METLIHIGLRISPEMKAKIEKLQKELSEKEGKKIGFSEAVRRILNDKL
jgi:hypothetical protein